MSAGPEIRPLTLAQAKELSYMWSRCVTWKHFPGAVPQRDALVRKQCVEPLPDGTYGVSLIGFASLGAYLQREAQFAARGMAA